MRAIILAAGRGTRMGSLTDAVPKPLLKVGDKYLIEYSIYALKKIGIEDIIINVSYLKDDIKTALGNGSAYGVRFHYSEEEEALETGGGIVKALPMLGKSPFIALSSDVICDYPLSKLPRRLKGLAHLVLVNNPSFHPKGDFNLNKNLLQNADQNDFTYANIGVYDPNLFTEQKITKFKLGTVLKTAVAESKITGEVYQGSWFNIGTPEDLAGLSTENLNFL